MGVYLDTFTVYAQFSNNLTAAVYLWVENRLLQQGGAYFNATVPLYYIADPSLPPQYIRYSSSFKSWNYDSGISGCQVIQYISGGSNVYGRSSGINIDYVNGGVIVPSTWGTNLVLTGYAGVKEVNLYQPSETEETILTHGKFVRNPLYNGAATGAIPPYVYCTPAIFLNTLHNTTEAFALGGLIDSSVTYSLAVYAESQFQLTAILSLFTDAQYKYIPMLNTINDPLNGFGDLKSGQGGYNYNQYISQWGAPGNLIYIRSVKTSKGADKVKVNPSYFIGLVDMEVSFIRQAPQGTNVFT